jgi:hypothetical protein
VEFATVNGTPVSPEWRPATGTYVVNANCTGSMEIVPGAGPVRKLRMVIVRHGKEIRAVEETNVVSSVGIKAD